MLPVLSVCISQILSPLPSFFWPCCFPPLARTRGSAARHRRVQSLIKQNQIHIPALLLTAVRGSSLVSLNLSFFPCSMKVIIVISIWGYCDKWYTILPRMSVLGIARLHPLSLLPSWSVLFCLPPLPLLQNVYKHPSPNIFPSPALELPFIRPWLFFFPSLSIAYSETLLSHFAHQCLSSLAPNFQIGNRPCLFLPCWGHSHLLLGSTHLSPRPPKTKENWELLASSRRLTRWAFLPMLEIFENGPL